MSVDFKTIKNSIIIDEKFYDDSDVLKLADENGWTIAHIQAEFGYFTENKDILKIECNFKNRWTVARVQVMMGWKTDDPEILAIKDGSGLSIQDVINMYSQII